MLGRVAQLITLLMIFFSVLSITDSKGQGADLQRGIQLFNEGEYEQSSALFNSLVERYPQFSEPYLMLAATYLEQGFPILAENTAEEGGQKFKNEAGFKWLIAESQFRQQKPDKAAEIYQDLFRYYETYSFSDLLGITDQRIRDRWVDAELMVSAQAYRSGDLEQAESSLQTVLRLRSDHLQALKNRVFLAMEAEDWERVTELAEEGIQKHPEDLDFVRMKANAYYQLEDLESLLIQYEKLYNEDPNDVDTAINYAEILFANQRGGDAEEVYLKLLQEYDNDIRIYRSFASLQERRMYIESKVSVLELMTEQFPDDGETYRDLAETYEMLEEWEKARNTWLAIEEMSGVSAVTRINVAKTWIEEGEINTAENILRTHISSNPKSYETVAYLALWLQEEQRWKDSLELLEMLPVDRQNREYGLHLAHSYFKTGNFEESQELLDRLIQNKTEEPLAYLLQAKIYFPQEYNRSLEMAEKAVTSGFSMLQRYNSIIETELEEGSVFTEMSVTREEVDTYNKLSEEALNYLLQTYKRGDIHTILEKLLKENSESPIFYYKMASFRYQHGESDDAMQLLVNALGLNPGYYDAHYLRGEILEENNELEQAELSYQRALSIQPDSKESYRSLIRINRKMDTMDALANRWKIRYRAESENELLREFLIEALQRADRFDEAQEVINN